MPLATVLKEAIERWLQETPPVDLPVEEEDITKDPPGWQGVTVDADEPAFGATQDTSLGGRMVEGLPGEVVVETKRKAFARAGMDRIVSHMGDTLTVEDGGTTYTAQVRGAADSYRIESDTEAQKYFAQYDLVFTCKLRVN